MNLHSFVSESEESKQAFLEYIEIIRKIIEDEDFQLEQEPDFLQGMYRNGLDCDMLPNAEGPFGFAKSNPIPVNGATGEKAYISRLVTETGERLLFQRIGSVSCIDVFEAVTFNSNEWFILYLDMYHPRRSKLAPQGFSFLQYPAQFSGFTSRCSSDFPYDFAESKSIIGNRLIRAAFMPLEIIEKQLNNHIYVRPHDHIKKLESFETLFTVGPFGCRAMLQKDESSQTLK